MSSSERIRWTGYAGLFTKFFFYCIFTYKKMRWRTKHTITCYVKIKKGKSKQDEKNPDVTAPISIFFPDFNSCYLQDWERNCQWKILKKICKYCLFVLFIRWPSASLMLQFSIIYVLTMELSSILLDMVNMVFIRMIVWLQRRQ